MTELRVDDEAAIVELRRLLEAAGYTAEAIPRALGLDGAFTRETAEIPYYVRLLPAGAAISALVKLFLLDVPVARDEAEAALGPLGVQRAARLGVVEADGEEVRGLVDLVPREELLVCSDRFRDDRLPDRPDHVYGPTPPTRALASLTVRRPVSRALDLGTGSGIQAILAAAHAERVVGADVNPRALAFTRFNALLNGVENVETREGDQLEPVAGERFDLIVSNPPHVVSPDAAFVFRDSGLEGDSLAEGLVRGLPGHLAAGGFAHVLLSWAHGPDERPSAPVERWLEASGCDAIVLHHASYDPLAYAAGWNRPLRFDPAAYAAALDRWCEYYRRLGIEALAEGVVVIRQRGGSGSRVRTISPAPEEIGHAGAHVSRLFAAFDVGDLLAQQLALVPGHRFEQTGRVDGSEPPRTVLRLEEGLGLEVELDDALVRLLAELAEPRPLRDAFAAVAAQAEDASPEHVAAALVTQVTRLVELGFLAT